METEDKYTRITLRIPKDLHARLSEEAEATSKSMNAEIVARLESSFEEMDLNQSIQLLIDELMKAGHRIDALERELSEARQRLDRFTQADKPLAELLREVVREEVSMLDAQTKAIAERVAAILAEMDIKRRGWEERLTAGQFESLMELAGPRAPSPDEINQALLSDNPKDLQNMISKIMEAAKSRLTDQQQTEEAKKSVSNSQEHPVQKD